MIIINKMQQSIYDCLSNQTSENFLKLNGILTYIEKNKNFPYIFISCGEIENISIVNKEIYSCMIKINIFDNNTNNYFINCLADEIKEIFKNKENLITNDYSIIDIKHKSFQVRLENENSVWNGEIKFEFIISSVGI